MNFAHASEPSNFQLRASAQADSTGIFLSQIVEEVSGAEFQVSGKEGATVAKPDTAHPAPRTLPSLRLCDSPAFGKISVLTREQITGLLRDAGADLAVSNCLGADAVRVSRRARAFTEADLLNLLTDTLQRDYVKDKGELELRPTRPWTELNLPDEPLTLKILGLPTAGVTSAFIARFQICTVREGLGVWQTTVQARVWREVWVAHSAIKRGEPLGTADIARERRDVLSVREALADFSTPDPALQLAEPVPSGNLLLARALQPRTVVHRGQVAQALLQDGTLSITMKVEVLEDGAPGQIIRARNPISRRDVSGKVLNEQTILITL